MTKRGTDGTNETALSLGEMEALNRHGAFLKKKVLEALQGPDGLQVLAEEVGVSFGGTRVVDIVACDPRGATNVIFIIECKRAYTAGKRWVFFQDSVQRLRVARCQNSVLGLSGVFATCSAPSPPVCSEGYELSKADEKNGDKKKLKADQDPIFKAAAQLSAGYLGFIDRRRKDFKKAAPGTAPVLERYVPVLVTTAELFVVQRELNSVSLTSGRIEHPPTGVSWDSVVLNHPFPTPDGVDPDFRDNENPGVSTVNWSLQHKESIYVVRAAKLVQFLSRERRESLRSVEAIR